jgi:urease accessory protein
MSSKDTEIKAGISLDTLPELFMLCDSALPIGGFSHSYGLETFIERDGKDVAGLLKAYIHEELAKVDCPGFVLAYRFYRNGQLTDLIELDKTVNAMRIPREWREAGVQTGRRLLAISGVLQTGNKREEPLIFKSFANMVQTAQIPGQYPVVAGVISAWRGIGLQEAILAFALSNVKNLISAAVRLVPLGQTEGLKIQVTLHSLILDICHKALKVKDSEDLGGFAPLLELAGIQHEHLYTRLFIS